MNFARADWKENILSLLLLLLLNPLLYAFYKGINGIFPDSVSYIAMGTQLLTEGLLYLPSWGHVDSGLILPPLYPLLIGIGRLFLDDGLLVSQYVSQFCMILAIVPLFFYVKHLTDRKTAIAALLIVQFNYYYFYYGIVALTEATFILTISTGLWLTLVTEQTSKKLPIFLLGVTSALIFFSRQIGLVFIIIIIGFVTIRAMLKKQNLFSQLAPLIAGFLLFIIPYTLTLYFQTGQFVFTQHFRLGHYKVTAPTSLQVEINQKVDQSYEVIYATRRELNQLLPDSSEMYGKVITAEEVLPFDRILEKVLSPKVLLHNLQENGHHLIAPIGIPLFIFFALATISSLLSKKEWFFARTLLPFFIASYTIVLSLFSGLIERYVEILFIYIIIHIIIEIRIIYLCKTNLVFRSSNHPSLPSLTRRGRGWFTLVDYAQVLITNQSHFTQKMQFLTLLLLFGLVLWLTPQLFVKIQITPKVAEHESPFESCKLVAKTGEAIFSFHPVHSYLLGGTFRTVPNDSLDKIVQYAKKTQVRWLVLTQSPTETAERTYYNYSPWLKEADLEEYSSGKLKKRCQTPNETVILYEIL